MLNDQDFAKTWRDANYRRTSDLRGGLGRIMLILLFLLGVMLAFIAVVYQWDGLLPGQYP